MPSALTGTSLMQPPQFHSAKLTKQNGSSQRHSRCSSTLKRDSIVSSGFSTTLSHSFQWPNDSCNESLESSSPRKVRSQWYPPMTDSLRDDLTWWNELVFENGFAEIPISMFDTMPPETDGWVIIHNDHSILIHGLTPRRTAEYNYDSQVGETQIAHTILQTLNSWVTTETTRKTWHHIRVYVRKPWQEKLLRAMYCEATEDQQHLRALALAQASKKAMFTATRILDWRTEARPWDVHNSTHLCDAVCIQTGLIGSQKPQPSSSTQQLSRHICVPMPRNSATGKNSAGVRVPGLDRCASTMRQARIVGLFEGLCALEGHNA
ncbi:hypothetical protein JG688_00014270 [Phytophthora aleatoria]|uniref:Uncharacterized protein n=1 Tax=Phytophthora aleatoria TaxID=2496075 RepID=A0A8J5IC45_9STRA|nr:hypothetical protein JG688_00014270 [Phytophthora aleatoria]